MLITLKELFKNDPKGYKKLRKKLLSKDPKERAKAEWAVARFNMEVMKCGSIF